MNARTTVTVMGLMLAACSAGSSDSIDNSNAAQTAKCTGNGCAKSWALETGEDGLTYLAPDLPRSASVKAVRLYRLTFSTRAGDKDVDVQASVAVPDPLPAKLHIVTNNPGTTGLDAACNGSGHASARGLAAVMAAQGWVGVATDFPIVGGIETYLVKSVEGSTVLDAVAATKAFVEKTVLKDEKLTGSIVVAGFSRGAHATLAAADANQSYRRDLDIRGFLAAAPPAMIESFWAGGLGAAEGLAADPKTEIDAKYIVHYQAMVVRAWQSFYGKDLAPWAASFDAAKTLKTCVTLPDAPDRIDGTLPTIIPASPTAVFSAPFVTRFTAPDFASAPGPFAPLHEWFTDNEITPFLARAPIKILQGTADGLHDQTKELVRRLTSSGMQIDYEEAEGVDHIGLALLPFKQAKTDVALAWIRTRLEAQTARQ
jgi:acetyl esterase/lipase